MPFKSKVQRRKFYAMEGRGEISMKKVKEWESETKGKKLPERVKKKGNPNSKTLHADSQRKFPTDTASHVRSSWKYSHQASKTFMYAKAELARIRGRIRGAAKRLRIKLEA